MTHVVLSGRMGCHGCLEYWVLRLVSVFYTVAEAIVECLMCYLKTGVSGRMSFLLFKIGTRNSGVVDVVMCGLA